jgi:hypothetical protein
MGRERVGKNT